MDNEKFNVGNCISAIKGHVLLRAGAQRNALACGEKQ